MTKEELIHKLEHDLTSWPYHGKEERHETAVEFLLEYIDDEDVTEVFEAINNWQP